MVVSLFMFMVITNTSSMNLIEKIDYELRRHLYIENIYYNFRSEIYSILKLDYEVSSEIVDNDLNIYKVGNRLVVESDNEVILNYQEGHINHIDKSNNTIRIAIDKYNVVEYRGLNSVDVKLYELVEVGDVVGTSKYDSFKDKYCYEIYVLNGDIDYIYEVML